MMSEVLNSDRSSLNVTAVENTSIQVEKHTMKETSSKATISEAPSKTSSSTENSIISNGGAAFKDVPDQTSRTPKKTCNAVMDSQVVFDHPLSLDKDVRHSDSDDDNFSAWLVVMLSQFVNFLSWERL